MIFNLNRVSIVLVGYCNQRKMFAVQYIPEILTNILQKAELLSRLNMMLVSKFHYANRTEIKAKLDFKEILKILINKTPIRSPCPFDMKELMDADKDNSSITYQTIKKDISLFWLIDQAILNSDVYWMDKFCSLIRPMTFTEFRYYCDRIALSCSEKDIKLITSSLEFRRAVNFDSFCKNEYKNTNALAVLTNLIRNNKITNVGRCLGYFTGTNDDYKQIIKNILCDADNYYDRIATDPENINFINRFLATIIDQIFTFNNPLFEKTQIFAWLDLGNHAKYMCLHFIIKVSGYIETKEGLKAIYNKYRSQLSKVYFGELCYNFAYIEGDNSINLLEDLGIDVIFELTSEKRQVGYHDVYYLFSFLVSVLRDNSKNKIDLPKLQQFCERRKKQIDDILKIKKYARCLCDAIFTISEPSTILWFYQNIIIDRLGLDASIKLYQDHVRLNRTTDFPLMKYMVNLGFSFNYTNLVSDFRLTNILDYYYSRYGFSKTLNDRNEYLNYKCGRPYDLIYFCINDGYAVTVPELLMIIFDHHYFGDFFDHDFLLQKLKELNPTEDEQYQLALSVLNQTGRRYNHKQHFDKVVNLQRKIKQYFPNVKTSMLYNFYRKLKDKGGAINYLPKNYKKVLLFMDLLINESI